MFYFKHGEKQYCVDATTESSDKHNHFSRLINHSRRNPNLHPKQMEDTDGTPHLVLVARKDIPAGEELTFDYGDVSKESIRANPWLKNT